MKSGMGKMLLPLTCRGTYPRPRRHNVQQTVEKTCLLPPKQKKAEFCQKPKGENK